MSIQQIKRNMGVSDNEKENSGGRLARELIETYCNLQRIKAANDREKEIDFQLRIARTQLELMGVSTKELNLEKGQLG